MTHTASLCRRVSVCEADVFGIAARSEVPVKKRETARRGGRSALWGIVFLIALMAGARSMRGQTSTGTIQGSVVDPGGRAIAGAAVAVTSGDNFKRTGVSDTDGKFSVSGLPAGVYSVQVSATGFATNVKQNVSVAAGGHGDGSGVTGAGIGFRRGDG